MKSLRYLLLPVSFSLLFIASCKNEDKKTENMENEKTAPSLKEENVTFSADGVNMNGFVVYDSSISGKRPGIIVVPEWWGLNDYAKFRARELAKLGYVAMAMDIYGDGKTAESPDEAGKLAGPFYGNPEMAKPRFEAAMNKLRSYEVTDSTKLGAIGYCFGGAQVINMAKYGEDLKGVVSFHGNLAVIPPSKNMTADILVCHGAADSLVPAAEVNKFKQQMDSVGKPYTFKAYEGAIHSFTNPASTAVGEKYKDLPVKYNAAADTASWNDMKEFFLKVFH